MRSLFAALAVATALSGCALNHTSWAGEGQTSGDALTVVTGRVNYVIDGKLMAPYGAFAPAWPAPPMMALSLRTGTTHVFPQVGHEDGGFRWLLPPGAYVVSSIGMGTPTDDMRIFWPRVVMCVPRAPGATVYLGHLRLEGARYEEAIKLSSGTPYTSRVIRYRFQVVDEALAQPSQLKHPIRHVPDMAIGDRLAERWRADAAGLERDVCGELPR